MERTLVLLKPDAVARRLVGRIIARLEDKGLWIVGMKMLKTPLDVAHSHYAEHRGKAFFDDLCRFFTSSPLVALVVEGPSAIQLVRAMVGATKVTEASAGTIRGDYALSTQQNLIHASDSLESAGREIPIWFAASELFDYRPPDGRWVNEALG
jgi:nucleoside-diphosphate kinase